MSPKITRYLVYAGYVSLAAAQLSVSSAGSPLVSKVVTDFEQRQISVSGAGFGTGPNILIYDTFEPAYAVTGEPITQSASQVGAWTEIHKYNIPTYSGIGRSGSNSVEVFSGETQKTNQIRLSFDGVQEVFVSYWVYLDGPNFFPGDLVSGPETFAQDSSFKMLWVFDSDVGGNSSDVVLPTHVGGGRFYLAGNDGNLVTDLDNDWWSWDHWMRVSFWLKANTEDPTKPGIIHFDTLSKDKGHNERTYNVPVFDADGPATKQYRQMNFPGWVRSIQSSDTNILYDDIYVSTGPNAAARVELGNAPSLRDVTELELLNIESWSDTNIKATASTIDAANLKNFYLYVTMSDGETNVNGIPLVSPPSQIEAIEVR